MNPFQRFSAGLSLLGKTLTGHLDLRPGSMGYALLKGAMPGGTGAPPTKGTQAHLQGYSTMPWVRAVASRVGHAVASTQWKLYATSRAPDSQREKLRAEGLEFWTRRKSLQYCRDARHRKSVITDLQTEGTLREITEHPLLDLLHEGNPIHSGSSIRKLSAIHRDLVGETFWLKDRGPIYNSRTKTNGITQIWPIAPHWVLSTPTLTNQAYRVGFRGWQGLIPATEMLWFKDPDPAMPYWRGTGVAQALSDELETDEYAAKFIKSFFYNHARPDVIVTPKGENASMNAAEMERLETQWTDQHQGFWRAFKPLFANKPVDVTVLEANFRQLQMKDLRTHVRDICLQVWGVNPEILGVLENSNRATIDAAQYMFNSLVVVPRLEDWRLDFQRLLVPEFDERLIIDYVSPVEDDKAFALEVTRSMPFAFEIDEIRDLAGKAPLEDDQGKFHMEPNTVTRVADWTPEALEDAHPAPIAPIGEDGLPVKPKPPKPALVASEEVDLLKMSDEELLDVAVKLARVG